MFQIKKWILILSYILLTSSSIVVVAFLTSSPELFCKGNRVSKCFLWNDNVKLQNRQHLYHNQPFYMKKLCCQYNTIQMSNSQYDDSISVPEVSRRRMLQQSFISVIATTVTFHSNVQSSYAAAATTEPSSIEVIHTAFENVRNELVDDNGGIPYMKSLIDNEKYIDLLEFTKTYDLILRKGIMGKAKKFLLNNNDKDLATQLCNNVTFDLIGINRSVRSKTNNDNNMKQNDAIKYLKELQDDIEKFLALEPKQV